MGHCVGRLSLRKSDIRLSCCSCFWTCFARRNSLTASLLASKRGPKLAVNRSKRSLFSTHVPSVLFLVVSPPVHCLMGCCEPPFLPVAVLVTRANAPQTSSFGNYRRRSAEVSPPQRQCRCFLLFLSVSREMRPIQRLISRHLFQHVRSPLRLQACALPNTGRGAAPNVLVLFVSMTTLTRLTPCLMSPVLPLRKNPSPSDQRHVWADRPRLTREKESGLEATRYIVGERG